MSRSTKILIAMLAVFAGSLLSDVVFGDGVQSDDIEQATMVAVIAGVVQAWLARSRQK